MNTGVLQDPLWIDSKASTREIPRSERASADVWNPDGFEREQILGLVRRVFFSASTRAVRQVVFSATESVIDVTRICQLVGYTLANETPASIAVVSGQGRSPESDEVRSDKLNKNGSVIRKLAHQVRSNLWFISEATLVQHSDSSSSPNRLESHLWELRRDFQYSVVESSVGLGGTAALGQQADGVILVVAAHRTRRVIASQIKETLETAHTRILGAVLAERTFPIPEKIYRHL